MLFSFGTFYSIGLKMKEEFNANGNEALIEKHFQSLTVRNGWDWKYKSLHLFVKYKSWKKINKMHSVDMWNYNKCLRNEQYTSWIKSLDILHHTYALILFCLTF